MPGRQAGKLEYSLRRYFVDAFCFRHLAQDWSGPVLDLGGHRSGKRGQFDLEQFHSRAVYLNLSRTHHPQVQGDAAAIPFRGGTFEAVMAIELLEHVADPPAVLREAARVLKPGGRLFLTVPFCYRIHPDPDDFGRYTEQYWRRHLGLAGFLRVEIEAQGRFWSVVADFLGQWLHLAAPAAKWSGRIWRGAGRGVKAAAVSLALWRESAPGCRDRSFHRGFTTGYGIRAWKEGPPGERPG